MNPETINRKVPDEISLKELLTKIKGIYMFLLSKWLIILFFGFLGGGLGYTYAFFKKTIYKANTTFVLEDSNSSSGGLGSLGGLASMVGVDLGGSGGGIFYGDNIMELYKSRTMIEKTLMSVVIYKGRSEPLIDRYVEFNRLKEKWSKHQDLKNLQFNGPFENNRLKDSILSVIVDDIRKNYLNVSKPDKKLSIINAEVKATDEFFAKAFNDQIVKNVNDFYVQTKTKKSLANVKILQQKTDSVRAVMNGAIYSAAVVTDATPNLNPTHQIQRVVPVQRSQFNAETNKAVLGELVKNLEMSKMALLKETPLIQVLDQPIFPLYKEKTSKVKMTIIGGVLAGFLACFVLTFKLILRKILI